MWDEEECNELRGTESSIFPPFKNKKDGIWAFEAAICRSLLTKYVGKSSYAGLPTSRHIIDLGDMAVSVQVLPTTSNFILCIFEIGIEPRTGKLLLPK